MQSGPARRTLSGAAPSSGPASFADIVDQVEPAVVSVKVKIVNGARRTIRRLRRQLPISRRAARLNASSVISDLPGEGDAAPRRHATMAQGSGFFISKDGYIVTNNHVVDHASDVTIMLASGKSMPAKVIGVDKKTDLALLKAEGDGFAYVAFASKPPRVGDWVIAVGNPFGLGGTVTAGIVSARGRDIGSGPYDDFLQIDAPVNHGNSGGPTFNAAGRSGRRQHGDFLAVGRQRRHRIRHRERRGQECRRPTPYERRRHARLGRGADSVGVAGHCRQPRLEERGRGAGRRGREKLPRRYGWGQERRRGHGGGR